LVFFFFVIISNAQNISLISIFVFVFGFLLQYLWFVL